MKVKVKIWYPVTTRYEEEKEIEIPDGVDPEEYISDNEVTLLEEAGAEDEAQDLEANIDFDYAGVQLLKEGGKSG